MSAFTRSVLPARAGGAFRPFASTAISVHGRAPAYRRLSTVVADLRTSLKSSRQSLISSGFSVAPISQPSFTLENIISRSVAARNRNFHSHTQLHQQAAKEEAKEREPEEKPKAESESSEKASSADGSSGGEKAKEGEQEQSEESKEKSEKEKEDPPPPPPHGDKTPWQVFTDTLQAEFKASKEWNESTKQLADGYSEFTQNETLRKAQEAYKQASGAAASTTSSALKTTGHAIGKSASWAWDTPVVKGVRKGVTATGRGIEKATRPVRETEAYKNVKEVIDDGSSSRYGGWVEKEERRRKRELRELNELKRTGQGPIPLEEDPDAGTNITLHKDARWKETWRDFRDTNPMMQRLFTLRSTYQESENPLISTARSISDRVAGFFAENETAMVIKKFREMDPNFQLEPFLTEMREYILPEVLDAYVKGDTEVLKLWLSAAQYQVYAALMQQYTQAGLKSDGRILDIRHVDILSARMLEPGDIPVFIVTCRTQEVHVYRNKKTDELAAGMDDKVQQVTYAIGVTRIPEDVSNPETRGWRLIELQKSARDYI